MCKSHVSTITNHSYLHHRYPKAFFSRVRTAGSMPKNWGKRSKSRSPFKCVVYNVNVSSLSPFLKNKHKNVFLFRSYMPCRVYFLAHLSRRLPGELIVYTCSVVRPSSSTISKIFFSETAWPIKLKFYVEPPWVGRMKVCSQDLGHMTKMAATPIYGKNPSKTSPEPVGRFARNLVCSIRNSSPSKFFFKL